MRQKVSLISTVGAGLLLVLIWGCAMTPNNSPPQDPFLIPNQKVAPQQRSRPDLSAPGTAPARKPRNLFDPYSSVPNQPGFRAPSNSPRTTIPARPPTQVPKTFADPNGSSEFGLPPSDNIPQKTNKTPATEELPENTVPSEGPQLFPMDAASTSVQKVPSDNSRWDLLIDVPTRQPVGSGVPFQLSVQNLSDRTVRNVSVVCEFDETLTYPGTQRKSVTHKIPRMEANEIKESLLTLVSDVPGFHECRISVREGGREVLMKSVRVEFISRQLDWKIHGPAERTVGSRAEFNIPLINVSRQDLRDLKIRVDLDAALTVREMTQGGRLGDRNVRWELDKLSANEGLLLQLELECREPTTHACLQVTISGTNLPQEEQEFCLPVKQRSGLLDVQMSDVNDPISLGDDAEFVVVIQNEGLQSAKEIETTIRWPEGLEFLRASLDQEGELRSVEADVDGTTARLAPLERLSPNQSVKYRIVLKGRTANTHEVQVSVSHQGDEKPVTVVEPVMVHQ